MDERFNEIRIRWEGWMNRPFPDGASDIESGEIDLMSIDTFAAGCIDTFVTSRGRLDEERIKILRGCAKALEAVLHELSGEINIYFAELGDISHLILRYLKR